MTKNNQKKNKNYSGITKSIILFFCIGIIEGGISSLIGLLLQLIHDFAIFGVLFIWLIFGWLTTLIIKIRTLDILTVIISASLTSFIILFLSKISLWLILIIIGISIFFWVISFITKILLFPKTSTYETLEKEVL